MPQQAKETINMLQHSKENLLIAPNPAHRPHIGRIDIRTPEGSSSSQTIGVLNSSSVDSTINMSSLPPKRKEVVNAFPRICDVADHGRKALFSRSFLTSQLGGSVQSVIARYVAVV